MQCCRNPCNLDQEQRLQNHQKTFYEKKRTIAKELNIKLEAAVTMEKSELKRIKYFSLEY